MLTCQLNGLVVDPCLPKLVKSMTPIVYIAYARIYNNYSSKTTKRNMPQKERNYLATEGNLPKPRPSFWSSIYNHSSKNTTATRNLITTINWNGLQNDENDRNWREPAEAVKFIPIVVLTIILTKTQTKNVI